MPNVMGENIQAVEIEGTVYVGGGDTLSICYVITNIVMAYDTHSNHWLSLPPYNVLYCHQQQAGSCGWLFQWKIKQRAGSLAN